MSIVIVIVKTLSSRFGKNSFKLKWNPFFEFAGRMYCEWGRSWDQKIGKLRNLIFGGIHLFFYKQRQK